MPFLPPNQQRQSTEGFSFSVKMHKNRVVDQLCPDLLEELA